MIGACSTSHFPVSRAEWIVGPDRGYIGRDYLELNHVLHKTLMKISSAANWCMIFPQFLLSLFQKVKYCSNLNQEWKYTVSGHWVVFPCLHFHYIPVFSIYYETWVYFQDVLGLRNCLFVYLFIHFRALWLISDVLKGSFSKIKTMSQLWKRVFQGSSGFFFCFFFHFDLASLRLQMGFHTVLDNKTFEVAISDLIIVQWDWGNRFDREACRHSCTQTYLCKSLSVVQSSSSSSSLGNQKYILQTFYQCIAKMLGSLSFINGCCQSHCFFVLHPPSSTHSRLLWQGVVCWPKQTALHL